MYKDPGSMDAVAPSTLPGSSECSENRVESVRAGLR